MIIVACKECGSSQLTLGKFQTFHCPVCKKDLQLFETKFSQMKSWDIEHEETHKAQNGNLHKLDIAPVQEDPTKV